MNTFMLLSTLVSTTMAFCFDHCTPGWTHFKGNCYRWYNVERRSWDNAQGFCQNQASNDCDDDCSPNLVSIQSEEENDFLFDFWQSSREPNPNYQVFWIGLRQISGSNYGWGDGTPLTYTKWNTGEPNVGPDIPYCAVMLRSAFWDDQQCRNERPFICEYKLKQKCEIVCETD